jgi:hypothetical protein
MAMGIRGPGTNYLHADLFFQVYDDGGEEVGSGPAFLIPGVDNGSAEDFLSNPRLDARRQLESRQIFRVQSEPIGGVDNKDGEEDEAQLRVEQALQKHKRLRLRLIDEEEFPLGLESRQAVGKLEYGSLEVVEFTKVSSQDLGHK